MFGWFKSVLVASVLASGCVAASFEGPHTATRRFSVAQTPTHWKRAWASWLDAWRSCADKRDCSPAQEQEALTNLTALRDWALAHPDEEEVSSSLDHAISIHQGDDLSKILVADVMLPKLAELGVQRQQRETLEQHVKRTGEAACGVIGTVDAPGPRASVAAADEIVVRCVFARPVTGYPRSAPDRLVVASATSVSPFWRPLASAAPREGENDSLSATFTLPMSQIVEGLRKAYRDKPGGYQGSWVVLKLYYAIEAEVGKQVVGDRIQSAFGAMQLGATRLYLKLAS